MQPIRTVGEITARIPIRPAQHPPLYQTIARKATQLRLLGMTYEAIGQALGVSPKLARNACLRAPGTGSAEAGACPPF